MNVQVAPSATPDLLTHTVLKLDGSMTMLALERMKRALQSVPGVLVADVSATADSVEVAHDGGVPLASLLAAATEFCHHATLVPLTTTGAIAPSPAQRYTRSLLTCMVTFIISFAIFNVLGRFGTSWWWLQYLVMGMLCATLLAGELRGKRR